MLIGVGGVVQLRRRKKQGTYQELAEECSFVKEENATGDGTPKETRAERWWFHMFSLLLAPVSFAFLYLLSSLNPIYSASISMFTGAVAATICRPDLTKNAWLGAVLFLGLYFAFFCLTNLMFPNFTESWNLPALFGILLAGVPLEELTFAFTFGMFWSGVYEHVINYTSKSGGTRSGRVGALG
jgi:hypothetical protein